jgi:Aspartyl protease
VSEFEFLYGSAAKSDLLYIDGPLIEVHITAPWPLVSYLADNDLPPYAISSGMALIDTGAAVSVVDENAVLSLEIPNVDIIWTQTAHGVAEMRRYNASVSFPGLHLHHVPLILAPGGFIQTSTTHGSNVIMLLDRDILRRLIVTYDGPKSRMTVRT